MQAAARSELIPRRALLVAGGVLAALLVTVGALRWSGYQAASQPDAGTVAQRSLYFRDLPDKGIAVVDAASGAVLDTLHGEQGFVRGTLRGLVRERKLRGLVADVPLQLIARADGRLTLLDPLTAQRIDLESFGPTNAAVFARWLPQGARP
jgi:putative photosynthetic complex assembly protein